MKEIELYDIITLDNKEDYTVIKIINDSGKTYYLLAPVDEDETPDLENIRIVEVKKKDNKTIIVDAKNEEKGRISDLFIDELRKGIN